MKNPTSQPIGKNNYLSFILAGLAISMLTIIAFSPLSSAGFVRLDDHEYIQKNKQITNLDAANIKSIFVEPTGDMYIPLVYLSYALEYAVAELDPTRYHTDNLALHIISSLLILWLIWLLTRQLLVASLIAGLFALHPLHTESVAWLSERKDVLYAPFFLGALISHYYYRHKNRLSFYLLSIVLFALSCLSKPMAVTLPVVLLIYDYLILQQRSFRKLAATIPFFVFAGILSIVTIRMMDISFTHTFNSNYNIADKAIMVLHSIFFYIEKTLFPFRLSVLYTYPAKTGILLPASYIFGAICTLALSWLFLFSKYTNKVIIACFLFYLATLLPTLQLLPNTYTVTADRYSYIPTLGIFGIVAFYLLKLAAQTNIKNTYQWAGLTTLLLLLSTATNGRAKIWTSDIALFSDIVEKGQYLDFVFSDLGQAYDLNGEHDKALETFKRGATEFPNNTVLVAMYAGALGQHNQFDAAIQQYLRCIDQDTTMVGVYINLGDAYLKTGKNGKAIDILEKGVRLFPNNDLCLYNLAYAHWTAGNIQQASALFHMCAQKGFQPAHAFIVRHNIP